MANIYRGIQGLLGGLGEGLSNWGDLRQQHAENLQKERQIKVQEAEALRQRQADEFERQKTLYQALNPEQDLNADEAQPFVNSGFKFYKNPTTGLLRRHMDPEEEMQTLKNRVGRLNEEGRIFFQNNPEIFNNYNAAQQAMLRFGLDPDDAPKTLQQIEAEAQAENNPRAKLEREKMAHEIKIQGMRDATDISVADKMSGRSLLGLQNRPIDEQDFQTWKTLTFRRTPDLVQQYNEALAAGKSQYELDLTLRRLYSQSRQPNLEF